MRDYRDTRNKRSQRARDRHEARQRRREQMATLRDESVSRLTPTFTERDEWQRLVTVLQDALWFITNRTSALRFLIAGVIAVVLLYGLFVMSSGRIYPNIWAMDQPLGGKTPAEAEAALLAAWGAGRDVTLYMDGEAIQTVTAAQLGLRLDAASTVKAAQAAGWAGVPFGYDVEPVLSFDYAAAQSYLLDLTEEVYVPPYEAGYAWENGELVGVPGRPSRELDLVLTMERLGQDLVRVADNQRLDLLMTSTAPAVADPAPYLDEARELVQGDFQLMGYDPIRDELMPWMTSPEEVTGWLSAGPSGLELRTSAFGRFVDTLNGLLGQSALPSRFLDKEEAAQQVSEAVAQGESSVMVRIRHMPGSYQIESQDNGFRIGRKSGLPFNLISNVNPGLEWNMLSIGQEINLPSRDSLLPETPVMGKRIIVDLDSQWLVAYENDEVRFSWQISSGMEEAPTYPGVFQILTHEDVAYGSSFSLCGDSGCGQWEMYWFMGVYEVTPGLMNGFHGAVLLPNGAYLGGGGVNYPSTFGCVMSENSNAEQLYQWAEQGTVVEIVSSEFPPVSDLGRQALEHIAVARA